jgi:hypothetical protein
MGRVVTAAAYVTADQTDPKILGGAADAAFIVGGLAVGAAVGERIVLSVATHWTAGAAPLFETGAVEDVLTKYCEKARGFVHAF